jgi:hypothetical protein
MHAHNELTFLNRLLVFSQNSGAEGDLYDQAQMSQVWCLLQLLAGKLYETWNMLSKRFSLSARPNKQDAAVVALNSRHQHSLQWLRDYFSPRGISQKSIVVIRNKTAFHYGGLDMGEALKNLGPEEKIFHVARHPVNALYWMGSAAVFGAIFDEIAVLVNPKNNTLAHAERVQAGFNVLREDIEEANLHIHELMYGLIKGLIEDVIGHPLGAGEVTTIDDVPTSKDIVIPPWIYIESFE